MDVFGFFPLPVCAREPEGRDFFRWQRLQLWVSVFLLRPCPFLAAAVVGVAVILLLLDTNDNRHIHQTRLSDCKQSERERERKANSARIARTLFLDRQIPALAFFPVCRAVLLLIIHNTRTTLLFQERRKAAKQL